MLDLETISGFVGKQVITVSKVGLRLLPRAVGAVGALCVVSCSTRAGDVSNSFDAGSSGQSEDAADGTALDASDALDGCEVEHMGGVPRWSRVFTSSGGNAPPSGVGLVHDSVYVAGQLGGGLHVGGQLSPLGVEDGYVAKFDTSGEPLWSYRLGGTSSTDRTQVSGLAVTENDQLAIVGGFMGDLILPGTSEETVLSNPGASAFLLFLAEFSPGGGLAWHREFGTSWLIPAAIRVAADRSGRIFVAGINGEYFEDSFFVRAYDAEGGPIYEWSTDGLGVHLADMSIGAAGDLNVVGFFTSNV